MASDNVTLNAGTGGASLRTFADANGVEWPSAVACYVATASPGANVLQPVQVGDGLPVKQDGTWTVIPSDTVNTVPWLASINQGGNTAVVDANGALSVAGTLSVDSVGTITGPVTVAQPTAASLNATVSIAAAQTLATVTTVGAITAPVTVAQSTASSLLCTASQGGTWNIGTVASITSPVTVNIAAAQTLATVTNVTTVGTITNAVTVAQPTAANLKATVSLAAAQTLDTVTTVGAVTSITNPVTVNVAAAQTLANVTTVGTITNAVTVTQATASSLKATVSLAAAQTLDTVTTVTTVGTITNPVAVTQSGTWNAGLSAGTNLIGKVSAGRDTSTVYSGTTAITPKFAKISTSASGDSTVVAAVTGKKIRVLGWGLTANGTTSVKWKSNTTDLTGARAMVQYSSVGGAPSELGRFETAAGEALILNLTTAVFVGGELQYIEVT